MTLVRRSIPFYRAARPILMKEVLSVFCSLCQSSFEVFRISIISALSFYKEGSKGAGLNEYGYPNPLFKYICFRNTKILYIIKLVWNI